MNHLQSPHEYMESIQHKLKAGDRVDASEYVRILTEWNTKQPLRLLSATRGKKPGDIAEAISGLVVKHATEFVLPAFSGDVEAAQKLTFALDNCERGVMAYAMWKAQVTREAYREYFKGAWDHDHHWVIGAAGSRAVLTRMFRYAEFELPSHLPDTVRVWRGTSHLTRKKAQAGYSWTTDRDTACWFAIRHVEQSDRVLVLAADVPKQDIAMYHDEREESEAVLLNPPDSWIDGDINDWRLGFERYVQKKNSREEVLMSELRAELLAEQPTPLTA